VRIEITPLPRLQNPAHAESVNLQPLNQRERPSYELIPPPPSSIAVLLGLGT
jgi:hypothetical protein